MTDHYQDICSFCENNLILTYICDDCNAVFCRDCLKDAVSNELICSDCGKSEIIKNKSDKFYCSECKSENIISVQKKSAICPNCSGNHVKEISERTESLFNEFKSMILETRRYLDPLAEKCEFIVGKSYKLVRLREDSIKIAHFPRLELEILQLIKLFNNIKESIKKKVIDFYEEININMKYFYNLDKLSPKTLPIVAAIAENMEKNSNENYDYIISSLNRLEENLNKITLKINFMSAIQSLFLNYIPLIQLEGDELPVFGLKCKLEAGENDDVEIGTKNGTILLTNRRLYFFHEKGLMKKKTVLLFSLHLSDLQKVQVEGTISKKLTLESASSLYKFRLNKEKRMQFMDFIEKARTFNTVKKDNASLKALKKVKITVQPFRNSLEDAIYTIIEFISKKFKELDFNQNIEPVDKYQHNNNNINNNNNNNNRKNNIDPNNPNNPNNPTNPFNENSYEKNAYPHLDRWFGDSPIDPRVIKENSYYFNEDLRNPEQNYIRKLEKRNQYNNYQRMNGNPNTMHHPREYERNDLGYLYDTYRKRPLPPREYIEPIRNQPYQDFYDQNYNPNSSNNPNLRYNNQNNYRKNNNYNNSKNNNYYNNYNNYRDSGNQNTFWDNSAGFNSSNIDNFGNRVFNTVEKSPKEYFSSNSNSSTTPLHRTLNKIRNPMGKILKSERINPDDHLKTIESVNSELMNSMSMGKSLRNKILCNEMRKNTKKGNNYSTSQSQRKRRNNFWSENLVPMPEKSGSEANEIMDIFPEYENNKPKIPQPVKYSEESGYYPKIDILEAARPRNTARDLMVLKEREYGITRTIEKLELRQKRGMLSEDDYLESYQRLQGELYRIQKQIEKTEYNQKST